jgi:Aluminium activated malate transporter
MFVALFCATLYATSESVHTLFRGKGLWAAITVTLALETNVGATWRKSSLRAMGTLLGGALGSLCVALTGMLCGGWVPGAPASKVLAMAFMVASCGSCVQYMRAHDPGKRDYAFQTCIMTMVLTSLSNFADGARRRRWPRSPPLAAIVTDLRRVASFQGILTRSCSL